MPRMPLLAAALAVLASCGGSGGRTPVTTTTQLIDNDRSARLIPDGTNVAGGAWVGDSGSNGTYVAFLWVNISSLPPGARIDDAELAVPVTTVVGQPAGLGMVWLDSEGRDQIGAPTSADASDPFVHQGIASLLNPSPPAHAGDPPEWRADVTASIQASVDQGKPYALFRFRLAGGTDNDGVPDWYGLSDWWAPKNVYYLTELLVTYTH